MPSSSTTSLEARRGASRLRREPAAVEQVLPHGQVREQAALLEHVADPAPVRAARRCRARCRPAPRRRPRRGPASGRIRPAMTLTSEVLPEPERPNSAVSPPPVSKRASSRKAPSRCRMSTLERHSTSSRRSALARHHLGGEQRQHRDRDRDQRQPQRAGIAARHLREGVDRRRQRLRLAGDVGDEGDGGAELAHRLGEAQDHAGDDAGQRSAAG